MAKVEGIGGIFIYSQETKRLADWYRTILGIEMEVHPDGTSFYKVFRTRDVHSGEIRENPVFAIIPTDNSPPQGERGYMLNLRVDYLDAYLDIRDWIQDNLFLVLLIAVLVGVIPESGPHLIFVTLFAQGSIPFSILLASSIVQDGHGTLPLLAVSGKAFVWLKLVNIAFGLLLGSAGLCISS